MDRIDGLVQLHQSGLCCLAYRMFARLLAERGGVPGRCLS